MDPLRIRESPQIYHVVFFAFKKKKINILQKSLDIQAFVDEACLLLEKRIQSLYFFNKIYWSFYLKKKSKPS